MLSRTHTSATWRPAGQPLEVAALLQWTVQSGRIAQSSTAYCNKPPASSLQLVAGHSLPQCGRTGRPNRRLLELPVWKAPVGPDIHFLAGLSSLEVRLERALSAPHTQIAAEPEEAHQRRHHD